MLVGRRIEHDPGILRRKGRQHDDACLLDLPFLPGVVIFNTGHAGPRGVGQHASRIGERPDLGAVVARLAKQPCLRVGQRAGWASGAAPAVMDASLAPLVRDAADADRTGDNVNADRLKAFDPHLAVAKLPQWRHRVRLAGRPPAFLGLGVARNPDLTRGPVVIRREIGIRDRPVEPAVVALHGEVVRKQPWIVGGVVERGAARAPAVIGRAADEILAGQHGLRTGGANAPRPDVGADQVRELPVRPPLEHDDLLACTGQHSRKDRARRARAHDDGVDFFVGHVTSSGRA